MEYLRYSEFEKEIRRMAAPASDAARLGFARDTIRLFRELAAVAIQAELTEAEQRILNCLFTGIEKESFGELRTQFEELHEMMRRDEGRAIDFDPDLIELLCAVDNLLEYAVARDAELIARIAINKVNSIDHALSGLPDNILAAPEMHEEYERTKRLLGVA